jgi:hypothetical protein
MAQADDWSRRGARAVARWLGSEDGSAQVAAILFAGTGAALAIFGGLHAAGVLSVPPLIFLVLVGALGLSGLDLWRERRRSAKTAAKNAAKAAAKPAAEPASDRETGGDAGQGGAP